MKLEELRCDNCGASLDEGDISEKLGVAKCGHCNALFSLALETNETTHKPQKKERQAVPLPSSLNTSKLGSTLVISWRWFNPGVLFLLFFAIAWNAFLIVWHTMALSSGAWFMSLFATLHTAVGVGVAYGSLTGLFNKTSVSAGNGILQVKHGPLPWKGNKTIPVHEIKQIYCKENIRTSKGNVHTNCDVLLITDKNRKITLLKSLTDSDQALYLEQELEKHLGIRDNPVRGEVPR